MKKVALAFVLLLIASLLFLFLFNRAKGRVQSDFARTLPQVKSQDIREAPPGVATKATRGIFVPYWVVNKKTLDVDEYETVLYFGIAPTKTGINKIDTGYLKLSSFTSSLPQIQERYLVLRMISDNDTLAILKDEEARTAVIDETIALTREHNFTGVALDLELSAIPFESLLKQVTVFVAQFSEKTRENDLTLAMTMYGDTFYRLRPFDVKALEPHVDEVMIMAYDFHKAGGAPGPNFPLQGREAFGYDFESMLADFLVTVPARKLSIIHGMFGYDWEVDEEGKMTKAGEPLSIHQINERILSQCEVLKCNLARDTSSSEMKISYVKDGKRHIVWFTDSESARLKEKSARSKGVSKVSFWAYSYF